MEETPTGTPSATRVRARALEAAPTSVRHARHLVDKALADVDAEQRELAVLLTDELVTNAVVHAGGHFDLELTLTKGCIRVEVRDDSPEEPVVAQAQPHEQHGRGMAIVAAMSTAWGVVRRGSGKLVWFELAVPG